VSRDSALLPPGFEPLLPYVEAWSLAGAARRAQRRIESDETERAAFYAAAKDLVPAAIAHLDRKPLAQLDASETRLMNLVLSFAHVALAVEVQGDAEARHSEFRSHFTITRASADS